MERFNPENNKNQLEKYYTHIANKIAEIDDNLNISPDKVTQNDYQDLLNYIYVYLDETLKQNKFKQINLEKDLVSITSYGHPKGSTHESLYNKLNYGDHRGFTEEEYALFEKYKELDAIAREFDPDDTTYDFENKLPGKTIRHEFKMSGICYPNSQNKSKVEIEFLLYQKGDPLYSYENNQGKLTFKSHNRTTVFTFNNLKGILVKLDRIAIEITELKSYWTSQLIKKQRMGRILRHYPKTPPNSSTDSTK